ncbi:PLDc N-terminal domain-containing protein [uncultured Sanguibacteroides sp.]|uniref:PLDc N-terminal domain-containing protein n=1 Tax=uncultured Sanguibacteroides sp. TaxID=1635151 RepID=UPI0025D5448A|nr:PLDc N-terminal domain-containing protein [uncultured Sanguibacteroides sp.]
MGLIIYIIGVVATVYAILDLVKKNISTPCKLLFIIVLLLTSWIGLIIYFLYAKDHVEEWCKQ